MSAWTAAQTHPWKSGNKPPPLFLDINPDMMAHPPVKVCRCGMTSSNMRNVLGSLSKNPVDVINRDGETLKTTPNLSDIKHCLVCACPTCNQWITWSSLVTKYSQNYFNYKALVEGIFNTLVKKVLLNYPSKECYLCRELTPYDNQKHDECINTHSSCICQGCEDERTSHRISEGRAGSLITRNLHNCNLCSKWHPTVMGQYLKEVPENHQVRRCLECICLFHQARSCGADEIPLMCQPCTDKKEKQREFVECTHCRTMCSLTSGCDLCVCGRNYDSSYLYDEYGNRIDAGCGNPFCYGCGTPFKQGVLVDYTCPCYIEGTYPKQYDLAKKQACQDKYSLLEWKYNIRDTILTIRQLGQLGDGIQYNLRQTGDIQNQHHQHHIINSDNVQQIVIPGDVEQTVIINDENLDNLSYYCLDSDADADADYYLYPDADYYLDPRIDENYTNSGILY